MTGRNSNCGGIRSWRQCDRPRERLREQGAQALADAELLAILLRTGIRGASAVDLARDLLHRHGGFRGLLALGGRELEQLRGLGPAKAAALLAAKEISSRHLKEQILGKNYLRDPQGVLDYLYSCLRDRRREVFKVLFLNKANQIVQERDLFEGTVDETAVHVREVVKAALDHHATGLVLVHNHPSGRVQPSVEDREITRKLAAALSTISVRIMDHLIIGDNEYFSFTEHEML